MKFEIRYASSKFELLMEEVVIVEIIMYDVCIYMYSTAGS